MKKTESKSKLEKLNERQIDAITKAARANRNVPLIKAKQVNMRLSPETLNRAKHLAKAQGKPVTSFLTALLKEDIERLWKVLESAA